MSFIKFNNKFIRLGGKLGKLVEPPKCPDAPTEIGWRVDDGILYIRAHKTDGYRQRTAFVYADAGVNSSIANTITKAVYEEPIAPTTAANGMYSLRNLSEIENPEYFFADYCTNMNHMFYYAGYNAQTFNLDLSEWNVSNVTDMGSMFEYAGQNASTFDIGDLSNWNVSNVTDMNSMFSMAGYKATTGNVGDLSNWNVGSVTNMRYMFYYAGYKATTFNIGDLSNGNVGNVTKMDCMFSSAGKDAPTFDIGDLSNWNVSNVTNMSSMFSFAGGGATTFNIGDLSGGDVSNVTKMDYMFNCAGYNATYSLDLSEWNVTKVTSHSSFNDGVESKITPPVWVN